MITRALAIVLSGLIMVSCALDPPADVTEIKGPDILYIHPDGTMIFRSRIMNEEDVIIYEDGRGGERAAVKLRIPRRPDVYRDTIVVERKDIPVERK
jgi:hypothetical protein